MPEELVSVKIWTAAPSLVLPKSAFEILVAAWMVVAPATSRTTATDDSANIFAIPPGDRHCITKQKRAADPKKRGVLMGAGRITMGVMKAIAGIAVLLAWLPCVEAQTAARDYPGKPVPFTAVHVNDNFWAPRIETNRTETIPFEIGRASCRGTV